MVLYVFYSIYSFEKTLENEKMRTPALTIVKSEDFIFYRSHLKNEVRK